MYPGALTICTSHQTSQKMGQTDDRSNMLSGGSVNSKESGSVSNNGSNDSESGMGDLENPSGIMDRHQAMGWVFNKGLKLIFHKVDNCCTCDKFVAHYSSAKAHLHSSHNMVCLAWQHLITKDVEEQIDGHQSQLKKTQQKYPPPPGNTWKGLQGDEDHMWWVRRVLHERKVHWQLEEDQWD